MKYKEKRSEVFALLAVDSDLDLRTLVQKFGISIHTLQRWQKEHKERLNVNEINKAIDGLIEVEDITSETLETIAPILCKPVELKKIDNIKDLKKAVTGLQSLKNELQDSAITLLKLIEEKMLDSAYIDIKGIKELAASLAAIQNAFFNKPATNINVNAQANVESANTLSEFRATLTN